MVATRPMLQVTQTTRTQDRTRGLCAVGVIFHVPTHLVILCTAVPQGQLLRRRLLYAMTTRNEAATGMDASPYRTGRARQAHRPVDSDSIARSCRHRARRLIAHHLYQLTTRLMHTYTLDVAVTVGHQAIILEVRVLTLKGAAQSRQVCLVVDVVA